jgi:hypothetical protein
MKSTSKIIIEYIDNNGKFDLNINISPELKLITVLGTLRNIENEIIEVAIKHFAAKHPSSTEEERIKLIENLTFEQL